MVIGGARRRVSSRTPKLYAPVPHAPREKRQDQRAGLAFA
jgi:hypothetical protein